MIVLLLILSTALGISQCCRKGYFEASNDTCLHLAQPNANKGAYCDYMGGNVFGRPLTTEMQDALAKAMMEGAEEWMPEGTWVGMERSGRGEYGGPGTTWKYYKTGDTFDPDEYSLWSEKPSLGDGKDCGAVGSKSQFKVIPLKCSDNVLALLCEKDLSPCDRGLHSYVIYEGHCLTVVKDFKVYDYGKGSCSGGKLFAIKEESELEAVWQAFYNSKFFGGIYIGLDKADNGAWTYHNGEKEEELRENNDYNSKCGVVRLIQNMTLGLFGQSCESERTWFLCERIRFQTASC